MRRASRTGMVVVWLGILTGAAGCGRPARTARPAPPGAPVLKVVTYNVNYGLAGDGPTLDAVRALEADVVFLVETNEEWEAILRAELAVRWPHMAFRHRPAAGGLGILSRSPFREVEYLPSPSGWFPAWRVRIDSPVGPVQALLVHLHPPISEGGSWVSGYLTTPSVRLGEIRELWRPGDDLVVGDLNEGGGGRAVRWLEERGMRSALPEFAPGAETWRWGTSLGDLSLMLDHILYAPTLEPLDASVVEAGRSDHWPVLATFIRTP